MSGTFHRSDDDHICRSRAAESEITHHDGKPPTPIQEQGEPIAFNNPEKPPETENSKSTTTSNQGDADSIVTPDSTGSMEVTFDVTYDLEAYLEEFPRLARKVKFDAAIELFHACPLDLKNYPEFILDFVDTLLRQGAYRTLADFAARGESGLMTRLSDFGVMPMHYLWSVFELGRWRVFGSLDGSLRQ
ncbi:hypothetical protein EYC80_006559 [Monilinia laxa]|uniref:Uncharacterized protein n=1 Tax=Monilinia laxa TaxID=61186 RepID=A0A5N6JV06_MONLA|nr:hypothetical protein EYC80_006559 [Monilinia laxa]